jgi:hypothetical protein
MLLSALSEGLALTKKQTASAGDRALFLLKKIFFPMFKPSLSQNNAQFYSIFFYAPFQLLTQLVYCY